MGMQVEKNKLEIIKHINKIQGQLDAVKKELEKTNTNCDKASDTLYAVSRSFASLRSVFVRCFLGLKYNSGKGDKSVEKLLTLIKG